MEEIIQFDKELLLMVNGSDSLFMDYLILTLTNGLTWIPLYLGLFYVVLKSNKNVRDVLLILGAAGLCYLLAGAVDDSIVKPLVARWRPGDWFAGGCSERLSWGQLRLLLCSCCQYVQHRHLLLPVDATATAYLFPGGILAD